MTEKAKKQTPVPQFVPHPAMQRMTGRVQTSQHVLAQEESVARSDYVSDSHHEENIIGMESSAVSSKAGRFQ